MKVAVIPVRGRLPLLRHTIKQALKVTDKVVCICDHAYEIPFCEGAVCTVLSRVPLGRKWNAGFQFARQFDPDYVLYIGSSDWVSDNWVDTLLPYAEQYEIVGVPKFHLLHLHYDVIFDSIEKLEYFRRRSGPHEVQVEFNNWQAGKWGGYGGERHDEPIGIGRILNRDYLKRVDFKPFDDKARKSMDYQQFMKAKSACLVDRDDIRCLSLSTNLWSNFHNFERDATERLDVETLAGGWFPEAFELTKWKNIKLLSREDGMR